MSNPLRKFCVWVAGPANDHLTGCGEIVDDVELIQYDYLETCPKCDDPILETDDYGSND